MLILCLDTSHTKCQVGIADFSNNENNFHSSCENIPYKQAEVLLPMIKNLMTKQNINKNQLSAISVACGPGSFSGIRIAIATAKTIGLVLNIPVLGYDNFSLWNDSINQKHSIKNDETILITLQSKRKDLYTCAMQNQKYNLKPQTAYPEQIKNFIQNNKAKIYLAGNMNEELITLIPEIKNKVTLLPEQDFDFYKMAIKARQDIINNEKPKAEPVYLRMPQTSKAKKIWTKNEKQ